MALFSIFGSRKERAELPFSTDMHCHVLPGVDDGSPDVETSVALVGHMEQWGIKRIIATPHVTEVTFENTPDILDPALASLEEALRKAGSGVKISRASENRVDDFFMSLLAKGQIQPMPNKYLLVENSFIHEPMQLDGILFDILTMGYTPIMAHPERYMYYHTRPERYDDLARQGIHMQINLLSLAGAYSKHEKKMAEKLIEKGYVSFVGTDLHNRRHVEVIEKYLHTKDARRHFDALRGRLLNDSAFV